MNEPTVCFARSGFAAITSPDNTEASGFAGSAFITVMASPGPSLWAIPKVADVTGSPFCCNTLAFCWPYAAVI